MSGLSIAQPTSNVGDRGPWGIVKDATYKLYNSLASLGGVVSQSVTKPLAQVLSGGYHGVVRGVGVNVVKNLKGSYRDGLIKKDPFSLTKAGWKKGKNFGGKYFGWLTGGALAIGGMVLAPWHPLKRTYEAGANIISEFGLNVNEGYTNIMDMNLSTVGYVQRTSERMARGGRSDASIGRKDWWNTLKYDWKNISRVPDTGVLGVGSHTGESVTTPVVDVSDENASSIDALAEQYAAQHAESEATYGKRMEAMQQELQASQEQAASLMAQQEDLTQQLAEAQMKAASSDSTVAVDPEVEVLTAVDDASSEEEVIEDSSPEVTLTKWLDQRKAHMTFEESDTKTLAGDYSYKIITGGLGSPLFDESTGVITIPTDVNNDMKDDIHAVLKKMKRNKNIGFSEDAARLLLNQAPKIFKNYLGDMEVEKLKKAVSA